MTAISFEEKGSTYLFNFKTELSRKSQATDNGPSTFDDVYINNVYTDNIYTNKVELLQV